MKEISCELIYSEELIDELNAQMNEYGQIILDGCDDSFIEVMPVDKKNFINDVQPIITCILNLGSQVAIGLFVNWLYDKTKELKNKSIVIDGKKVEGISKEELEDIIKKIADEKK